MKRYLFADLVTFSQLTPHEAKYLIQRQVIQPDEKKTSGSGDHSGYGFLDLFEGCIVHALYQRLGSVPINRVSNLLDAMRAQTAFDAFRDEGWAAFLEGRRRRDSDRYFLCVVPAQLPIVDAATVAARVDAGGVVVTLRLDTLLLDLEQRTNDRCSAEDRRQAWDKFDRPRGGAKAATKEPSEVDPPKREAERKSVAAQGHGRRS